MTQNVEVRTTDFNRTAVGDERRRYNHNVTIGGCGLSTSIQLRSDALIDGLKMTVLVLRGSFTDASHHRRWFLVDRRPAAQTIGFRRSQHALLLGHQRAHLFDDLRAPVHDQRVRRPGGMSPWSRTGALATSATGQLLARPGTLGRRDAPNAGSRRRIACAERDALHCRRSPRPPAAASRGCRTQHRTILNYLQGPGQYRYVEKTRPQVLR